MTPANFDIARRLLMEKHQIESELKIWAESLVSVQKLAYLQSWNSNHAVELNSKVPQEIFDGFRKASINCLRLRLVEIDQEFAAL